MFNARFAAALSAWEQRLPFLAIALVALSIGLIMAPAAYHRQTNPREVSERFLRLSTRLLLWSMWPLALSLAIDVYLVGRVILGGVAAAVCAAGAVLVLLIGLWFVLPRVHDHR